MGTFKQFLGSHPLLIGDKIGYDWKRIKAPQKNLKICIKESKSCHWNLQMEKTNFLMISV